MLAERHVPELQVYPEQHSELDAHALPEPPQAPV